MTMSKMTGIRALAKLRSERAVFDAREAKARREAAIELGEIVLSTGADVLPLADLKNVLVAAVAAHVGQPQSTRAGKPSVAQRGEPQTQDGHGEQA
jgi:hypothetical protein